MSVERHQTHPCPRCHGQHLTVTFRGTGAGTDTVAPQGWEFVGASCANGCRLHESQVPTALRIDLESSSAS